MLRYDIKKSVIKNEATRVIVYAGNALSINIRNTHAIMRPADAMGIKILALLLAYLPTITVNMAPPRASRLPTIPGA